MAGIFITSTGTGIGKTHLTAQLLQWDNQQKNILNASKPIISGWPSTQEEINQTDTGMLLAAQNKLFNSTHIDDISPWRFSHPLSPEMAAKKEGKEIDFAALIAYSKQKMAQAQHQRKIHLMEGVGGVMVPLTNKVTVLDWIEALACPALLVVGSYLGTLSHTLTAVKVLEMKKIPILGVVVNETPESTVSLQETSENLQALLASYSVFSLNYIAKSADEALNHEGIDSLYSQISTKMGHFL